MTRWRRTLASLAEGLLAAASLLGLGACGGG